MRRSILGNRILAMMLSVTLFMGQSNPVQAAEMSVGTAIEVSDHCSVDVSGDVSSDISGDVSGDVSSDISSDVSADIVSSKLFSGLPLDHVFSEAELKEKDRLRERLEGFLSLAEGVDCQAGEILVAAESEEDAKGYAQAFDGTLKEWYRGLARIALNADHTKSPVTVLAAVQASAEDEYHLPAAWPNFIYHCPQPVKYAEEHAAEGDARVNSAGIISGKNDTNLSSQWHHEMIGSETAWAAGYTGKGATVAVISTGFNADYSSDLPQVNAIDIGYGTEDTIGTGTHMAGVIAAKGNNLLGGCGVAPDADLVSIKVTDDTGTVDEYGLRMAIYHAQDVGADVICVSHACPYEGSLSMDVEGVYAEGSSVICAAGDASTNTYYYPASCEYAFGVGAVDRNKARAYFSNHSNSVDFCAPGVDIYSHMVSGQSAFQSSTAQAAAVLAGEIAVMISAGIVDTYDGEDVDALRKILTDNCEKASGEGTGSGVVKLSKALKLSTPVAKPKAPVFADKSGTYLADPKTVEIRAQGDTTIYYSTDGKNITYKNGQLSANAIEYKVPFTVGGKASVTVKAIAVNHVSGLASSVATVKYKLTPEVKEVRIVTPCTTVMQGEKLQLKAVAYPEYARNRKITRWRFNQTCPEGLSVSNTGLVTVGENVPVGSYMLYAGADEGSNDSVYINVVAKQKSNIKSIAFKKSKITMASGLAEDMPVTIKLLDGTTLNATEDLSCQSDKPEVVSCLTKSDSSTIFLMASNPGTATITMTARDGSGKKATLRVTVVQGMYDMTLSGPTTVAAGKSVTYKADIYPKDTKNKKLRWELYPKDQGATISTSGKLTTKASASGKYILYAYSTDGTNVWDRVEFTVVQDKVKTLTIDKKSRELFKTDNGKNIPTKDVITVNATSAKGVQSGAWEVVSSNPGIVSVSKLSDTQVQISAVGGAVGSAVITIKSTDGTNLKKTCKVTVNNPATSLEIALPAGRSTTIAMGKKLKLTAILGTDAGTLKSKNKKIKWSVDNTEAFKIDQKGNVTALKNGHICTVTAETTDGSNLKQTIELATTTAVSKIKLIGQDDTITMKLYKEERYPVLHCRKGSSDYYDYYRQYVCTVNKPGLWAYYEGGDLVIDSNKPGTYKLTISMSDGNTVKRTYTVKVE